MADPTLPAELTGTLLGRRLAWFLDRLRDGGAALTDEEVSAVWVCELPGAPAAIRRSMLGRFASMLGKFSVLAYPWSRGDFAVAILQDERARTWRAWVQLEPDPSQRIRIAAAVLNPPPGVTLRPAEPGDAAALRALEMRCPIAIGDLRVTYDRGEDYFAGARLIGDTYPMVAERDGRIVAMHCMVTHEVRVAGLLCGATYLHHSRILPEEQRGGLFSALNGAELERNAQNSELFYSYVAVGNEAALKVVPVAPWAVRPERLVLDCRAQAGPSYGRSARPEDAPRIVALINAAHEREELFVPYTAERLAMRLGREPAAYGWTHLLVSEHAVVGVWPAGMRIVREQSDRREESVRALVVDTGFLPGAEAQLVALVRAWCAQLAESGHTHLALFTSPGSPGRDSLRPLAERIEPYHLNIGLPEDADLAERGVYVDHLYF